MAEACLKTIIELVAKEYFEANDQIRQGVHTKMESEEPGKFENEECSCKNSDFCDADQMKNIEDSSRDLEGKINNVIPSDQVNLSKVKVDNLKEEQIIDTPKTELGEDETGNITSNSKIRYVKHKTGMSPSPVKRSQVYYSGISKIVCVIEEESFNFIMYKTPMKDANGPFYINNEEVSVGEYELGLQQGWNPTQVVYELCMKGKWGLPEFVLLHHSLEDGFHFGVTVKDCHFVPAEHAFTKRLAKHRASAFFLHFLGFRFIFENSRRLAIRFRDTLRTRRGGLKHKRRVVNWAGVK